MRQCICRDRARAPSDLRPPLRRSRRQISGTARPGPSGAPQRSDRWSGRFHPAGCVRNMACASPHFSPIAKISPVDHRADCPGPGSSPAYKTCTFIISYKITSKKSTEFMRLALFMDVFFWPFFQLIQYHCPSILTLRRKCGIIALPFGKTTLTGGEPDSFYRSDSEDAFRATRRGKTKAQPCCVVICCFHPFC